MPRGVNSKGRGKPHFTVNGEAAARPSKILNGGELGERTGACPPRAVAVLSRQIFRGCDRGLKEGRKYDIIHLYRK